MFVIKRSLGMRSGFWPIVVLLLKEKLLWCMNFSIQPRFALKFSSIMRDWCCSRWIKIHLHNSSYSLGCKTLRPPPAKRHFLFLWFSTFCLISCFDWRQSRIYFSSIPNANAAGFQFSAMWIAFNLKAKSNLRRVSIGIFNKN